MKRINPIAVFSTPKDITEVQDWIAKHNTEEQPHLYTASMMTWNLMAGYHNDHVDTLQQVIEMLLVQVQDYSENEVVNGDGNSMTIEQIKELIK